MINSRLAALGALFVLAGTAPAFAYSGPGLGLGIIGAIIGLLGTIFLAIVGLFWYPIKRMLKKNKAAKAGQDTVAGDNAQ